MHFRLRFYGGEVLRLLASRTPRAFLDEGPMLEWHPTLGRQPARLEDRPEGWQAIAGGRAFFRAEAGSIGPQFSRDGKALLEFQAAAQFFPHLRDALPVLRLERPGGPQAPHEVAVTVDVQRYFDHFFAVFSS